MCMIDGADDHVLLLSAGSRIARKQHKCWECGRRILSGERYLAENYVFDGRFNAYKVCQHCEVAREWLSAECGGFLYEGVFEDIYEHVAEGYGLAVMRLAAGMEKKWRRKDGRLWPIPRMPSVSEAS